MHFAIDDAFREAGIEIAFPQRDLHVRSVSSPLPVRILGDDADTSG
jgi:small-conductance mechanosensitive channel